MSFRLRAVTLLNYPFRVFFVAGSIWALLAIAWWVPVVLGTLPAPGLPVAAHWHAHEMIHGMTGAMIAGFLLTALSNWTGIPAPSGRRLAFLFLLWLVGRLVLLTAPVWPVGLTIILPGLFYLALAASATRDLIRAGNRRNLIMPVVLILLGLSSTGMLAGSLNWQPDLYQNALVFSLYLITVLMVIVAGRITPAFTRNALRMTGGNAENIGAPGALSLLALLCLVAAALLDVAGVRPVVPGGLLLAAGALHAARLWTWRGWRTGRQPLLWILHLGYLALVASLFARSGYLFGLTTQSLWIHLTGVGAMGLLILGVMTRVSLGHTGRPLRLPPLALIAYGLMILALILRILSLLYPGGFYTVLLGLAGLSWCLSFGAFLWAYLPVLTAPRTDGRPG